MLIGVLKETFPGEQRVALIPSEISRLTKIKCSVIIEAGAGDAAGFQDASYTDKGATVVNSAAEVFAKADLIVQVQGYGSDSSATSESLSQFKKGQGLIAFLNPLGAAERARELANQGVTGLSMELVPRITRAQSMDALSSMATVAGYKAVLLAANELPKLFPMMMTAAGSLTPAKVFVLGVGVAGLQAIATAKRLGAVVEAYDIRPEVKEQVQSVGGKFVELPLETRDAGDSGGYAKEQSEDFIKRQQELMADHIRAADVVITTAAIPGRKAPRLVTAAQMEGMRPGSVLIDLAADSGGNCELTEAGKTIVHKGIRIIGPSNVPSSMPHHASQMYARNVSTFLAHLTDDEGNLNLDMSDEITAGTLVCHEGVIVHERVKQALEG